MGHMVQMIDKAREAKEEQKLNLQAPLEAYMEHIKADYVGWMKPGENDEIKNRMVAEFKVYAEFRPKYIRILKEASGQTSVHSFVVFKPTKGYVTGDILKPAGYKQPEMNFKRGSIFNVASYKHRARWTGIS